MKETKNTMATRSVFPLLISMSLPVIFSMLIQSLYNIVDSFWVAKLGTDDLTAVALAFPLQNCVMSVGIGTGIIYVSWTWRQGGSQSIGLPGDCAVDNFPPADSLHL